MTYSLVPSDATNMPDKTIPLNKLSVGVSKSLRVVVNLSGIVSAKLIRIVVPKKIEKIIKNAEKNCQYFIGIFLFYSTDFLSFETLYSPYFTI